jgi:hypothetical protein
MKRVRSFLDQDLSRSAVAGLCSRFAVDALALVDSSTTEDFDPKSKEARAYTEFRAWLGPQLALLAQSNVVGPVLNGLAFDEEGFVSISVALGPVEVDRSVAFTRAGRLAWLVTEIPSLIEAYRSLYPEEEIEAFAECKEADALDLAVAADLERSAQLMPKLEQWYTYAQPGYRIFRGDEDAQAEATKQIEAARERVRAEFERRAKEQQKIDRGEADGEKSIAAMMRLSSDLSRIDSKMAELSREIDRLNGDRGRVLDDLEFVEDAQDVS